MKTNSTLYTVGNATPFNPFLTATPPHTYADLKKKGKEKVYVQSSYENGRNACSMFAPIQCVANQFNVDFSDEDLQDIIDTAIPKGYDPSWGWTMSGGTDHVVSWVRNNKSLNLVAQRVNWRDYRKLSAKGFGIICGYNGHQNYWDSRKDGKIGDEDKDYDWGMKIYGHLVTFWNKYHLFLLSRFFYLDNYGKTYKYKETFIKPRGLAELVADQIIFPNGYILAEK